jgi:hypothetical protein
MVRVVAGVNLVRRGGPLSVKVDVDPSGNSHHLVLMVKVVEPTKGKKRVTVVRNYDVAADAKSRISLRGARTKYFHVMALSNGSFCWSRGCWWPRTKSPRGRARRSKAPWRPSRAARPLRHRRSFKSLRDAMELNSLSARAVNVLGRDGIRTREQAPAKPTCSNVSPESVTVGAKRWMRSPVGWTKTGDQPPHTTAQPLAQDAFDPILRTPFNHFGTTEQSAPAFDASAALQRKTQPLTS